ncbi:MAG TPA: hypothetical protein VK723_06820, partial [Thermoplasmata archaeon]|nr:hypothetical protein [Thermoplasmata archaeon]
MEAGSRRSQSWKVACALLALVAAAGVLGGATPAGAHSGDVIDSLWASSPPTVDGTMTPGEWAGAMAVDLGAIPGNFLASSLLVMNDATYLWVAYDAVGDRTASVNDSASFAFDTGHDAVGTNGAEDQFIVSGIFAGGSAHLVYSGGGYIVEDSPFDPGLPDHAGLAGARGFGPSDLQSADHRIYEFQIPLVLVGANPGDTLGLFGGSQFVPGVLDYEAGFAYSTWPTYVTSPIPLPNYGDLVLAALSAPIGVSLSPSATSANGVPGETIWYNLTARNTGTSVNDTFDVAVTSAWTAALWNATGAVPLADTDGDTVPDTGNLTPGGRATFIVKVSIPPSATGCDVATITATSSWNLSISDSSTLNTCVGPAMFAPPHSDVGLDDNGNGKFDRLRVNVSVNVGQSGVYFIIGDFFNANHTLLIMSIGTGFAPPAGSFVVPLDFDGRTIFTSGQDGPYPVELTLYDSSFRAIDSDTYLTRPYNATDFEPPRALFRPPHTDVGVDTDVPPNGFYD